MDDQPPPVAATRTASPNFSNTHLDLASTLSGESHGDLVQMLGDSGDWLAVITSDHGVTALNPDALGVLGRPNLEHISSLSHSRPANNQRAAYFFPQNPASYDAIVAELQDRLDPQHFAIVGLDADRHDRIFGPGLAAHRARPGSMLLLNVGDGLLHFDWDPGYKLAKASDHGGLTDRELVIPFAAYCP